MAGAFRLSLVSFAIRLYPASVPARQIAFHQIDRKSKQRVWQQLIVPDKGPIERADIVTGYEYQKDHYIEIEPDDLAKLRLPAKHRIDIAQFVASMRSTRSITTSPIISCPTTRWRCPPSPSRRRT